MQITSKTPIAAMRIYPPLLWREPRDSHRVIAVDRDAELRRAVHGRELGIVESPRVCDQLPSARIVSSGLVTARKNHVECPAEGSISRDRQPVSGGVA